MARLVKWHDQWSPTEESRWVPAQEIEWSPNEEIGWVPTQEIRWYPVEEIGWVRSEEILHFMARQIVSRETLACSAISLIDQPSK